jgi:HPt (histidine-containing phosphotransfer) domain-containing protein
VKTKSLQQPFVFRGPFDTDLLHDLYEDDFNYMEDVFLLTLFEFKSDLSDLRELQFNKDLQACRKQLHKMKPSLGYVGLKRSEEHCGDVEEKLKHAKSWNEINEELGWLIIEMQECCVLMEATAKALNSYNEKSKNL